MNKTKFQNKWITHYYNLYKSKRYIHTLYIQVFIKLYIQVFIELIDKFTKRFYKVYTVKDQKLQNQNLKKYIRVILEKGL